ncbi:MAG TPA: hypothetical protein VN306_01120 [Mycobacterium sp.]|nr:hypothetical protein [Mycobacterium sp.]
MTISDVHPRKAQAAPKTETAPRSQVHSLTQRILHSVEQPTTGDEFDGDREFDSVLADYDPVFLPLGSCYPEWR